MIHKAGTQDSGLFRPDLQRPVAPCIFNSPALLGYKPTCQTNLVIAGPDYFGWATNDVPEYADKPPESLIKFHNAASGADRHICPMLATIRLERASWHWVWNSPRQAQGGVNGKPHAKRTAESHQIKGSQPVEFLRAENCSFALTTKVPGDHPREASSAIGAGALIQNWSLRASWMERGPPIW